MWGGILDPEPQTQFSERGTRDLAEVIMMVIPEAPPWDLWSFEGLGFIGGVECGFPCYPVLGAFRKPDLRISCRIASRVQGMLEKSVAEGICDLSGALGDRRGAIRRVGNLVFDA